MRGARKPSEVFANAMAKAKSQLLLSAKCAEDFKHSGIRGDERAAGLSAFLRDRLPSRFAVTKGEVIDFNDQRTGQLDIVIYDTHTCPPLSHGKENDLIPAEAIYAIVEVKTTLTQDELNKCYCHAKKIRQLRPFKKLKFVSARRDGSGAGDQNPRCIYSVFSYFTNLSSEKWLEKEFLRVKTAATASKASVDLIDRLMVLSEGFILPASQRGKIEKDDQQSIFLDFYLHLINFLSRESSRRPPIDWQMYGPRNSPGWEVIE